MSLTPICRDAGGGGSIFPRRIPYSALFESGYSSTGTVATDCTIALGFKPTAASIAPLNDMTAHYLLTIQKVGTTVRVWKQGVELENYTGTVGATYAAFLSNVLTAYCGSNKGYYSNLYVAEQALTYTDFWECSDFVTGLWVAKEVVIPTVPKEFMVSRTLGVASATSQDADREPARAFDGLTSQSHDSCAMSAKSSSSGVIYYGIGKDFGAGNEQVLSRCKQYGPNNYGTVYGATGTQSFALQGSQDGSNWTTLGSISWTGSVKNEIHEVTSNDLATKWRHARIYFTANVSNASRYCSVAEVQFNTVEDITYGPGGGLCDFSNALSLGEDSSGSGNDWTMDGEQTLDTPTHNQPTFNPLDIGLDPYLNMISTNGNRTMSVGNGGLPLSMPIPLDGKWSATFTLDTIAYAKTNTWIGIVDERALTSGMAWNLAPPRGHCIGFSAAGSKRIDAVNTAYGTAHAMNDTISVNVDMDAGSVSFGLNGVDQGVAENTLVAGSRWFFCVLSASAADVFSYLPDETPPTEFTSIGDFSELPAPTILKSAQCADVVLREGKAGQQFTGGTPLASSTYDTSVQNVAFAFDGNTTSFWQSARETAYTGPWWIAYLLPAAQQIASYSITPRSSEYNRSPGTFVMQGSNTTTNGSDGTWTDLDARNGITFNSMTPQLFAIATPDSYSAYRLYITYVPDSYGTTSISEWIGLVGDTVIELPDMEGGPDFVNIKDRDTAYSWVLSDKERGANKQLYIDQSIAETSTTDLFTRFTDDGYALGNGYASNAPNDSFLDLCLKAGIDQGFEIVTYSGQDNAQSLSHSLGKAPTFIVVKNLSYASGWRVYHVALGASYALELNDTLAAFGGVWNGTEPTRTTFDVSYNRATSMAGDEYIAYLFTDSDIFKAFSYTGNLSTDGPFVNLGGKPLSVPFLKNADAATDWLNFDSARSPSNPLNNDLFPNQSYAEGGASRYSFTSVGFKNILNSATNNGSGNLHVGLAILESTKYSNAY
ncbi:MAG: hypothetical protein OCC46_14110 [Pseudodesulfovibrio sp.]